MPTRRIRLLLVLFIALTGTGRAMADPADELRNLRDTTIALVNLLVDQGVLTRAKADELIHKAELAGAASAGAGAGAGPSGATAPVAPAGGSAGATPAEPPVVRVPYVPEVVREQIRDQIKQDVLAQAKAERWGSPGALPPWIDRISFAGDVRFRVQADRFPTDNSPNATPQQLQIPQFGAYTINNTSEARNRLRLRARFGAEAKVGETVTAGVRLTTGTSGTGGDPSSENETLGNYNARGAVGFDRAYVSYHPSSWFGFTGGRLGNPFFAPTTMVWADDLSLQGAVASFTPELGSTRITVTAGAFPIQEIEPTPLTSSRSKWLFGYQGGVKFTPVEDFAVTLAAGLYDYRHIQGIPNPTIVSTQESLTAAAFRQKGNSVFDINDLVNTLNGTQNYLIGLASKFREVNVSTSLDYAVTGTKHLVLDADYVKNIGFDRAEILARTGLDIAPHTTGTQVRLSFGDASFAEREAWNAYVGYRHVGRDSVVDAFTDSDFHLGGTNATGYYLGGRYAFERNSTVGLRWFSAKEIDGLPLAIDVLQLDLITSF